MKAIDQSGGKGLKILSPQFWIDTMQKITLKKGNQLNICFTDKRMCRDGLYTIDKVVNQTTFMVVTKHGGNIMLDIRDHGKAYRIQSIHETAGV